MYEVHTRKDKSYALIILHYKIIQVTFPGVKKLLWKQLLFTIYLRWPQSYVHIRIFNLKVIPKICQVVQHISWEHARYLHLGLYWPPRTTRFALHCGVVLSFWDLTLLRTTRLPLFCIFTRNFWLINPNMELDHLKCHNESFTRSSFFFHWSSPFKQERN